MKKLKYLNKLGAGEIAYELTPALEDGFFRGYKIIEDNDEEVMLITIENGTTEKPYTSYYLLNDYQVLSILSKYNMNTNLKFNIPTETLINPKNKKANKNFLKSMISRFKDENYSEDAIGYYSDFTENFENLKQENLKIIKHLQYSKFNGDFRKAQEEAKVFKVTYGYNDYAPIEELTKKTINYIEKETKKVNQDNSERE